MTESQVEAKNWWSRLQTPLGRLQAMSYIEGVTLLVLVAVAVPLKYAAGMPIFVRVLGPIHGIAFILYSIWLIESGLSRKWSFGETAKLWISAFIPLGFLYSCPILRRKETEAAEAVAVETVSE